MIEKITTRPFDMANYLHNENDIVEYLQVAFESGDEKQMSRALATATRAKGILQTAKKTGLNRSSLYKTLINNDGMPNLKTVNRLVRSFGLTLSVTPLSSKLRTE